MSRSTSETNAYRDVLFILVIAAGFGIVGFQLMRMGIIAGGLFLVAIAIVPVGGYLIGTYLGVQERSAWLHYEQRVLHAVEHHARNNQTRTSSSPTTTRIVNRRTRTQTRSGWRYPFQPRAKDPEHVPDNNNDWT